MSRILIGDIMSGIETVYCLYYCLVDSHLSKWVYLSWVWCDRFTNECHSRLLLRMFFSVLDIYWLGHHLVWIEEVGRDMGIQYVANNVYCLLMMTSSNGNIFRVTGPLCGEFPTQRPATQSFDIFFDLRLNKRLSKQPWGWWFETSSWSLWRQCNVVICFLGYVLSMIYIYPCCSGLFHMQWCSTPGRCG